MAELSERRRAMLERHAREVDELSNRQLNERRAFERAEQSIEVERTARNRGMGTIGGEFSGEREPYPAPFATETIDPGVGRG